MTKPLLIEVRGDAGYVRYSEEPVVETLDVLPSCSVAADIDHIGRVVGIEILFVDNRKNLAAAHAFAKSRNLAFPRDLSGTVAD